MASYKKEKNGTWTIRFYAIEGGTRVQKKLRGNKSKSAADFAMAKYLSDCKNQMTKSKHRSKELPFYILYGEFVANYKHRVKEGTYLDFVTVSNKNILPYFKDKDVKTLTPKDILKWQNNMNKTSLAYRYKLKIRRYLGAVLRYAYKYYNIPYIMDKVDPIYNSEPKKEMRIWSRAEFEQFISVVDDPIYKSLFIFLYYTGTRKGEALAITWEDIDLEARSVNINKSLSKATESSNYKIVPPKNQSSYRKLLLPQIVINELLLLKEVANKSFNKNDYVFGGKENLTFTTVSRKKDDWCDIAGVKKIRIHDFRHSHASQLLANGENIVMVAKRLGHASIEQTLNTYAHLMPNQEEEMIAKLETLQ